MKWLSSFCLLVEIVKQSAVDLSEEDALDDVLRGQICRDHGFDVLFLLDQQQLRLGNCVNIEKRILGGISEVLLLKMNSFDCNGKHCSQPVEDVHWIFEVKLLADDVDVVLDVREEVLHVVVDGLATHLSVKLLDDLRIEVDGTLELMIEDFLSSLEDFSIDGEEHVVEQVTQEEIRVEDLPEWIAGLELSLLNELFLCRPSLILGEELQSGVVHDRVHVVLSTSCCTSP